MLPILGVNLDIQGDGHQPSEDHVRLLSMATWNVQGKHLQEIMQSLDACDLSYDVLALQELTCLQCGDAQFCETLLDDGFSVCWHAQLPGVFRRVGLVLEAESKYRKLVLGHSHMQLEVLRPGCPRFELYIVAHFPHCAKPEADFVCALQSFEECLAPYTTSACPMLLLGDLNYPLVGDASSRAVMLACCLKRLSLTVYSHDSAPTRIGGTRRLDHIAVNWCLASSWALQEVQDCTVPLRPPSYRDSDAVKQLIQARRMTVDPCVRKHLSLRIFQTRAQDRCQWRRRMLDKAAQGDWGARRAILRGAKKPAVFAPLVREQGGRDEAVRALRAHYHAKLGVAASVECDHSSVFQTLPWVAHADQVENEADLSGQEVCEHLFKMKSGTTTGMSGVSTDFLKAACGCDAGLHVVRSVLQDILDDPDCFEQGDLFEGLAVLMPKKKVVTTVRETRPIVLGDVIAKLLGRVCMARFLQYWPPPPCLFGGRRGVSV